MISTKSARPLETKFINMAAKKEPWIIHKLRTKACIKSLLSWTHVYDDNWMPSITDNFAHFFNWKGHGI